MSTPATPQDHETVGRLFERLIDAEQADLDRIRAEYHGAITRASAQITVTRPVLQSDYVWIDSIRDAQQQEATEQ